MESLTFGRVPAAAAAAAPEWFGVQAGLALCTGSQGGQRRSLGRRGLPGRAAHAVVHNSELWQRRLGAEVQSSKLEVETRDVGRTGHLHGCGGNLKQDGTRITPLSASFFDRSVCE